jgi:hydrogenase nickel incorporation protein HypA/HybF
MSNLELFAGLKLKQRVVYNIVACFLHQMHELGVTENIVNIALAKAAETQVNKIMQINLVVGELSGFSPDCIQFYFDFLRKDTIAQGALLHFESVPAQLRCRNCSAIFQPQDTLWSCPKCQGQSVEIFKGRELYIESMEAE